LGQPEGYEDWDDFAESDLYGDIVAEITGAIERHADSDAAAAWSTLHDQDLIDIEEAGYEEPIAIGWFGNWGIAVDGDVLIDPGWEKELKLARLKHPQLWGDVGTRELTRWLEKHGYERLDRFGGRVPGTEEEIQMDFVHGAVADELGVAEDVVAEVAKREGYGEYTYSGSSGDVEVWAKPVE